MNHLKQYAHFPTDSDVKSPKSKNQQAMVPLCLGENLFLVSVK